MEIITVALGFAAGALMARIPIVRRVLDRMIGGTLWLFSRGWRK